MTVESLPAERLTLLYKPEEFGFRTTAELDDFDEVIGQERAVEAMRFGAEIRSPGYNLFLLGQEGTGKQRAIMSLLKEKAAGEAAPADWVYVSSFTEWHRPNAMRLPPGRGSDLATTMQHFIEEVRVSVPAYIENEENQNRLRTVSEEFQQKPQMELEGLRERAAKRSIALMRTPTGFGFAPMAGDQVIKPDVFEKLPEAERARIEADIEELQKELQQIIKRIPRWDKDRRDAIRDLLAEMTAIAIGAALEQVTERFSDLPEVLDYLEAARLDLIENFHGIMGAKMMADRASDGDNHTKPLLEIGGFERYKVNPLVTHDGDRGAPVVFADHPTLSDLTGRIEHVSHYGSLVTDFNLIKAGSLHRANGGYLVIEARKLLLQPFSWDALKRALKARDIKIESPGQALSLISTLSLEPEPIPLDVKVVLLGDRLLYYLLSEFDPEFPELFKVEADFDEEMERDGDAESQFMRSLACRIRQDGLHPFNAAAVAEVMRRAVRLAGDRRKLSIKWRSIVDLLHEASFHAGQAKAGTVGPDHVRQAVAMQVRRSDRLREKSLEAIERDLILIETDGRQEGQVNGLSVLQLGGFAFGRPSRITARVRLGAGKVIDIEREVELGGPLHSKGILILSGYLSTHYAAMEPFSLNATLVFEQSYGGVEGDSASSAELYALLSALSEIPLRQDLAVTGSVNQFGQVQAIGGVNEKIEGFFDLCSRRGLTGSQGVLIPATNRDHLILREDVVAAAAEGAFHIYSVATIDEGIELLTGREAGTRDAKNEFPKDTVNGLVETRLKRFAAARRAFGRSAGEGKEATP